MFNTNATSVPTLPRDLRSQSSQLYRMSCAVSEYRDVHLDNSETRAQAKALVMGFQACLKTACPHFARYKDESFGVTCDSGRDGQYFRAIEECHGCLFLNDEHALTGRQLAQVVAAKDFVPLAELVAAQADTKKDLQPYVDQSQRAFLERSLRLRYQEAAHQAAKQPHPGLLGATELDVIDREAKAFRAGYDQALSELKQRRLQCGDDIADCAHAVARQRAHAEQF
jgi:hypothetical protein